MRKKIVAGNWKMNTSLKEGAELAKALVENFTLNNVELIVAPPFTHLDAVSKELKSSPIKLSSQNMAKENLGAYTGEVSGEMLKDLNVEYAIIGHSERRMYYGETNEILFAKTQKAIDLDIQPIFCVGENLEQRESGIYFEVIKEQLEKGLFAISKQDFPKVVVAYEPVWAIGTGKTASKEQAQEIHSFIRQMVSEKYGEKIADNLSLLYGGSCKPGNAKELFSQPDIDGGLIGGAALISEDFIAIAQSF